MIKFYQSPNYKPAYLPTYLPIYLSNELGTMLNTFVFRIVGRLIDPLVGVHGQQLDGSDCVVPGCAGLSVKLCKICPKYMIYFTTFTSVVSSDIWT